MQKFLMLNTPNCAKFCYLFLLYIFELKIKSPQEVSARWKLDKQNINFSSLFKLAQNTPNQLAHHFCNEEPCLRSQHNLSPLVHLSRWRINLSRPNPVAASGQNWKNAGHFSRVTGRAVRFFPDALPSAIDCWHPGPLRCSAEQLMGPRRKKSLPRIPVGTN